MARATLDRLVAKSPSSGRGCAMDSVRRHFVWLVPLFMVGAMGCGEDSPTVAPPRGAPIFGIGEAVPVFRPLPPVPQEFLAEMSGITGSSGSAAPDTLTLREAGGILSDIGLGFRVGQFAGRIDRLLLSALEHTDVLVGLPMSTGLLQRSGPPDAYRSYTFSILGPHVGSLTLRAAGQPDIILTFTTFDRTLVRSWNGCDFWSPALSGASISGRVRIEGHCDLILRSTYQSTPTHGGGTPYVRLLRGWVHSPTEGRLVLHAQSSGEHSFLLHGYSYRETVTAHIERRAGRVFLHEVLQDEAYYNPFGGGYALDSQSGFRLMSTGSRLLVLSSLEISRFFENRGPYNAPTDIPSWRAQGDIRSRGVLLGVLKFSASPVPLSTISDSVLLSTGGASPIELGSPRNAPRLDGIPSFFSECR